ncbi:hypothetical protein Tco_0518139 [Tanacetum coccineum]
MVAYLDKTEGNAEFHEVIDFLARSSIHHALTVTPVVSTTFVEQFWMSAKSKIINNVRYITTKVAGKHVSISEASIRSDLLFDDADGIDSLPNQAIFDAIQLMGYEGDLTLANVPVPLDHFLVNALTSKVFSFMVKKGKHFSGKVTPLFASMLVQSTEDEGATSERPSEPQPTPSPPYPSEANVEPPSDPSPRPSPTPHIPNSIPESSDGNQGGHSSSDKSFLGNEGYMTLQSVYDLCISLCTHVSDQAKEIMRLKTQIKNLKKQAKPVITHHRAWMQSVSLKHRLAGKRSLKKTWMQKESVSKQGRKSAKGEPSVHKDSLFDEIPEDTLDYMETEDASRLCTAQEKVSTDTPKVSTDGSKVSTDKEKDSTERTDEGTDDQTEGRRATQTIQTTQTPTSTMFGDDETIAQVLLNMSQAKAVSIEKEKGVEFKDVEETERPRPTSTRSLLTLKPLPKIDPKDKGKKKIEEEDESETESEGIPEAEKKFKQLASDEEMARKLQEDWETEEERKRLAKEEATNDALIRNYDDINARIEGDRLLAKGFKEQERRSNSQIVQGGGKEEEGTKKRKSGHIKMIARKKPRKQSDDDSDDEHRKYLKIITFEDTLDSKIMEKKSVIARLDKLEDGMVIHMLVERRYPLSKELLQRMLDLGLEVERESIRTSKSIHKQMACGKDFSNPFLVDNLRKIVGFSNHLASLVKSWLVQDQTVLGKDYSNLLIADSLLKTIWFINAPCYGNEASASPKANELTIPEQTTTGKGISNPLMAGSLPKTTKPT